MPAINKVIYGNNTLIDLTGDTVTENTLVEGTTAHGADGVIINGAILLGDDLGYGDNTQPMVGVAALDFVIPLGTETSSQVGTGQAGFSMVGE